jgi:hypothetical protein
MSTGLENCNCPAFAMVPTVRLDTKTLVKTLLNILVTSQHPKAVISIATTRIRQFLGRGFSAPPADGENTEKRSDQPLYPIQFNVNEQSSDRMG